MKISRTWLALGLVALVQIGVIAVYVYVPPSPYRALPGDSVDPVAVRAGEDIYVTRRYEITRAVIFRVTRRLTSGTCPTQAKLSADELKSNTNCEAIDLPYSEIFLQPGFYERRRSHTIPHNAKPGVYALKFTIHWEDRFGRTISEDMPPLEVEVKK